MKVARPKEIAAFLFIGWKAEVPVSTGRSVARPTGTGSKTLLAMISALASTACWAGRPLATEDAGVLDKRACELESFAGKQAHSNLSLSSIQVGCGVGLDTQLALGTAKGVSSGSDTGYMSLSGKTAFQELTSDQAGFAIAYALTSSREKSDSLKYLSTEIKTVLTVPYKRWLLHGNMGAVHLHPGQGSRVTWGVAAELPNAIGPFDLMGEVYGDNKDKPWLQIAARWKVIPERLFLDASYGIQTGVTRTRLTTAGLKLAF